MDDRLSDWWSHAVCGRLPSDLFFDKQRLGAALHICRTHCPVLAQCHRAAKADPPDGGVQGGVAWRSKAGDYKGRCRYGPALTNGCVPSRSCRLCTDKREDDVHSGGVV